ncbi:MAG: GNAT family N-acetyltransferase [Clostridia bacterium]|nr:GNAT family N-acetyltransferase [Clostridia bacterium]
MKIRRAETADVPRVMVLLSEVLEIHAAIRPDIFVPGTTKYTEEELAEKFKNDETPVYVADIDGVVAGYVFCVVRERKSTGYMTRSKSLYIDDLCVDGGCRGKGIGKALFDFAVGEAKRLGCGSVTLAVWEGNDGAYSFYKKMGMKPKETIMEYIPE